MLATKGKDRAKWLKDHSDQTLGNEAGKQLKDSESLEQLLEALDKKIAKKVTPRTVPKGAIVLQPSDERRRSGSHYTPRSLTEPIVRTTLEPILKQLFDPEAPLPEIYQPSKEDKRRYTQGEIDARMRLSERAIEHAGQARAIGTPHPSQILDLKICDPAMGSGAFLVEACRQLADELVKAWYAHKLVPSDIPPDEDEVLFARRQVAQRCLYGVDKNEMAVDLAKLSLWLVTLAKDHPFTFLDHSLRHGDSLVGLTRKQIIGFHWEPKKQKQFGEDLIQKRLDRATEARAKILNAREDVPYRDQEQRLALADEALNVVRMTGDACISAFFAGKKAKEREKLCEELFFDVARHFQALKEDKFDVEARSRIACAAASMRTGAHPVPPFHWEIEFPEVFSRSKPGFDGVVGNPPFLGGTMISSANGTMYKDWLYAVYAESGNRMDLVAYFLRRSFESLRQSGVAGLIATNSIAQGDTRSGGLLQVRRSGGDIYSATRRMKWPGEAAVIVSVVHVARQTLRVQRHIDGKPVEKITAFLFHNGSDESPSVLNANANLAYEGVKPYGQGFIFDDNDEKSTPVAAMNEILAVSPHCQDLVFPYISGEEINDSPTHQPHRYIINFGDRPLEACHMYEALLEIVESKVKPERMKKSAEVRCQPWWRFFRSRPEMLTAISALERILVVSRVGDKLAFTFISSKVTPSEAVVVLAMDDSSSFAVVQCRAHETWARFFGSSMKDDLRYTPTDCFLTFPFPANHVHNDNLTQCGDEYVKVRATLMIQAGEGLTKTYNRFHDPHETSPEILKLRELHDAMDRAVLEAYGWHDLGQTARCEFLLDYEEDDDETGANKSKKKKPWRLRWPDDFRDEVLARLLELNEQRHKEELLAGKQLGKTEKAAKPAKVSEPKRPRKAATRDLFASALEPDQRLLLMLLRAWNGRAVTRRLLNEGLILMLDDKLRAALVATGARPKGRRKATPDLNQILTELEIDGFTEQIPSAHQQAWRVTATAPATDDSSAEDVRRLAETMEYLNRAQAAGQITVSEETVDANVDLIPA